MVRAEDKSSAGMRVLHGQWPSAQGRGEQAAHRAFEPRGHGFAVDFNICWNCFAITDDGIDRAQLDECLDVRQEIEVAIPRHQRAVLAAHGDAVPACVDASSTAPSNAERNGRTRLPSLEVPSAKRTTDTPSFSRLTMSATASPA